MKQLLSLILLISFTSCFAQRKQRNRSAEISKPPIRYENYTYLAQIKTVEFYNRTKEQSIPVITLGSNEDFLLGFDDLRAGSRNISYTIEHCDAAWNSSRISPIDYLES